MTKKQLYAQVLYGVIFLRIIIPIFVMVVPVKALITSLILDSVDGQLCYELKLPWSRYNLLDKLLDYWWYLWIILFFFFFIPQFFWVALALLGFRSIGQIIGILFRYERAYVFFPNLLEVFFLLALFRAPLSLPMMVMVSLAWALFLEWQIHIGQAHLLSKYLFRHEIHWQKNNSKKKKPKAR